MDNHSAVRHYRGKNIRLDWRMCGLTTGGHSDYFRSNIMHRDKSYLCLKYFPNKDKELRGFRLILFYNLIHN